MSSPSPAPTQPLPLRPLGKTGLMVSALGLGTVALGRSEGLKYPKPVRIPSDDEVITLLSTAADLNVRLIDTAPAYGTSEERMGVLLPLGALHKGRRELRPGLGDLFVRFFSRGDS
jgi:diketogulonate reductase-like aldo/keto reductase